MALFLHLNRWSTYNLLGCWVWAMDAACFFPKWLTQGDPTNFIKWFIYFPRIWNAVLSGVKFLCDLSLFLNFLVCFTDLSLKLHTVSCRFNYYSLVTCYFKALMKLNSPNYSPFCNSSGFHAHLFSQRSFITCLTKKMYFHLNWA